MCEAHLFNCPLSREKADRLVKQLAIADDSCVLDVGCGEGEFLIQIAERYKISGIELDSNPECIALANEKARLRVPDENLSFVCQDARSFNWEAHKVDLIICIG
nr:class I SAM-dependent methyltransferase [Fischerella sp. PCC 9605]